MNKPQMQSLHCQFSHLHHIVRWPVKLVQNLHCWNHSTIVEWIPHSERDALLSSFGVNEEIVAQNWLLMLRMLRYACKLLQHTSLMKLTNCKDLVLVTEKFKKVNLYWGFMFNPEVSRFIPHKTCSHVPKTIMPCNHIFPHYKPTCILSVSYISFSVCTFSTFIIHIVSDFLYFFTSTKSGNNLLSNSKLKMHRI